ncbi:MAG: cation diffusion facilitator family transporter [Clostridia bacterium]
MNNDDGKKARNTTIISFIINCILSAMKLVVGIIGASGALIADGIHSLSDLATDIIVLVSIKIIQKPADESHNYGHGKVETFATVIVSIALFIAGFSIGRDGVTNLIDIAGGAVMGTPTGLVVIVAGLSFVIKEILFRYSIKVGRSIGSEVMIANAWHHRSDSLSSLGVLAGAGGAYILGADFAWLDSAAQVIVSLFIFKAAYKILVPNIGELVDASLDDEHLEKIKTILAKNPSVLDYHHLRTRKIGNMHSIDVHILVKHTLNIKEAHDISTEIEHRIKASLDGDSLVTIHIEPYLKSEKI